MYDPRKPYKEEIIDLISSTWKSPYIILKKGDYSFIKDKKRKWEVDHTDGIGTKGFYHWKLMTIKNAVLDALAMNLNDLLMARAYPYKLQNHIIIPKDNKKIIFEIVRVLVDECKKRKIVITGGETSVHDNSEGLEISLTVSGLTDYVEESKFIKGDLLIGIASSGIHSSGITKVREIFKNSVKKEFVAPTFIYFDSVFPIIQKFSVNGLMHITGGAHTRLKTKLNNKNAVIRRNHKLFPHKIFKELHNKGVDEKEMYKIFNCGIGFILSVKKQKASAILQAINKTGFKADIIGEVVRGQGKVIIESMFSSNTLVL